MKTKIKYIALFLVLIVSVNITPPKASAQGVSVGFQVFYDELSPYGTWVDSPDYGYVWIPDVAPGFAPYSTNGYWVFTVDGWTWVSNYSWGWAPFHYGRWYMDDTYGAMWVPDYEWGPGWVTWRRSAGFYGWAPLGPGVSISIGYSSGYYVPNNQWTFVRDGDFGRTNINQYYINNSYNVTIIHNSTVINNTRVDQSRHVTYNAGPERSEVETRSGRRYNPVTISERTRPGQNLTKNQLQIYRPQVERSRTTDARPAPVKVGRLENMKTSAQRKAEAPNQKTNPATRQQPVQQQRNAEPAKQQPQQQRSAQPAKQQQPQQQRNAEPAKQQPQQQRNAQPAKQQQPQQQRNAEPAKQQPSQHQVQPARQQPSQPQQAHPSKNGERETGSQPSKPPKNM
ncbi:MAG: hypothetical protein NT040_15700 [Bacteroidetes bacterium]|nr:hypothetical protein [Bacteroidota bacterium]